MARSRFVRLYYLTSRINYRLPTCTFKKVVNVVCLALLSLRLKWAMANSMCGAGLFFCLDCSYPEKKLGVRSIGSSYTVIDVTPWTNNLGQVMVV